MTRGKLYSRWPIVVPSVCWAVPIEVPLSRVVARVLLRRFSCGAPHGPAESADYPPLCSEGKYWSELISPVMGLARRNTGELNRCAPGGDASHDVTGFVYKSHPPVQSVSERSRIEVGAAQTVPLGLRHIAIIRPVSAVLDVQHPARIETSRISVEDPRQRKAQLGKSAATANRLKNSG
jgi:hypothetical protein